MILTHRVDGEGPPLVLLNGGLMSFSGWDLIAAELAGRFAVVRCDFSGQLRSPGPAHVSLERHADDVVALLDHLGCERAAVVGTSFGAQVGLVLAARHPERGSALVAPPAAELATRATAGAAHVLGVGISLAASPAGTVYDGIISIAIAGSVTGAQDFPMKSSMPELQRRSMLFTADVLHRLLDGSLD